MQLRGLNWLIHDIYQQRLAAVAPHHVRGRLLDIGCGDKKPAPFVRDHTTSYIGLDHPASLHGQHAVDVLGLADSLPFADDSFDTAICIAVLEHLEEPLDALREAFRVLRPGGKLILTAPFFWHLHEEPRDFYRYTRFGLEHLFIRAGFTVLAIEPLAGFWVTFCQEFAYYVNRFAHRRWLRPVVFSLIFLAQAFAALVHPHDRSVEFSWLHLAVAQKPVTQKP